jgi:Rrf2 family protein
VRVALGRKADYSVRAVLDLASHFGRGRRKAREIATVMDIPERYLGQILADLVRADLLSAVAGPDGGYSLKRPPADMSLLEVVEAAEGPLGLDECVLNGGPCDWESVCPIHAAWSRAQRAFTDGLATTSFAEFAAIDAAIQAGEYQVPDDAPLHPEQTERRGKR